MRSRAVFLDRDGVLNRKQPPSTYVTTPDELEVLPGVGAAVRRLNEANYLCIVVTNQRGIGRGLMTASDLEAVHAKLIAELAADGAALDGIRHCPHDHLNTSEIDGNGAEPCRCRKPAPGMILDAMSDHGIDRSGSILIGDSQSDIEAASSAGIGAIYIGPASDAQRWTCDSPQPLTACDDLGEAVDWFLERADSEHLTDHATDNPMSPVTP